MERTEWARDFFKNDRFATEATGIEIEKAEGRYAKCVLKTAPRHMNAVGSVMGGALFTFADFTFAVASNQPGQTSVSVSSEISYISKAKGGVLTAEAKCLKHGRTVCFYVVEIKDAENNLVASVSFTGCCI